MAELILASASPRRRELLRKLGRPFRVVAPEVDETPPPGLSPRETAEALARRKARSVARRVRHGWVLGADTLVAVRGEIMGKPRDRDDAIRILQRLSRERHEVITGICLIDAASGRELTASEATAVAMRPMTREEIERYASSGEGMDKAGAYAIQESGDRFVEHIEGSLTNVVGLPVELVRNLLDRIEEAGGEGVTAS